MTQDTYSPNPAPHPPRKRLSAFDGLQIATPILVSLSGALMSYLTLGLNHQVELANQQIEANQQQLESIKSEFGRAQTFSQEISRAINELSGKEPVKAKIALISLYNLAQEEQHKSILVHVAIASERKALQETIYDLLASESPEKMDQYLNRYPALLAAKTKLLNQTNKKIEEQSAQDGTANESGVDRPPEGVEARLLSQLTAKDTKGWIFIGRINRTTRLFESDVLTTRSLPQAGSKVKLSQRANIRQTKPKQNYRVETLPALEGALEPGSIVQLGQLARVYSSNGHIGIWAYVDIRKKVG